MKRSAALEPLSHDHHEGLAFVARLRRARRTGEDSAPLAAEVAAFWREHLVPHFQEEEAFVLPILKDGAAPLAAQMVEEHRAIRALVETTSATPDSWDGLVAFSDALAAHIRFEEREAFPAAERLADAETLARIGSQIDGSRRSLPPLSLPPDEVRRLGYRVVDMIVDHVETLPEKPVSTVGTRAELEDSLWEPPPEQGAPPDAVLDQLQRDVFAHVSHVDHPRFFAFIPGPSNVVGALADALVSGLNPFAGTWLAASGPAMVELVTVDWLCRLCGLPETAGGLFTSGGSAATLTALATARHVRLDEQTEGAVVYASDQTHSSVARALRTLGFADDQLRTLPSDDAFRLDPEGLRQAVRADRAAGRTPFCVVANAGTTNTGAVDPLAALADVCHAESLWLHVDGAYGAAAVLSERGRTRLAGLDRADSITVDPHKWFFQPYEIGGLLVRDRDGLAGAFRTGAEYLEDAHRDEAGEVNFGGAGVQLSRRFRALKLWLSLKVFGLAAFRQAVEHGFDLAELAERTVGAMPGWEVTSPAGLGIVTFRYAPDDLPGAEADALNRHVLDRLRASGFAMLSSTTLRGRVVLRLCPINPRTTEVDVRETLTRLDGFVRDEREP